MATNKRFARRAGFYFGLALFLIATLLPFFVMLMTSFKSPKEAISLHPTLFPQHWTLEHYVDIFNPLIFPFVTYFRNSLVVSVVSSGVAVFIGILGAYALSKLRFKGRMTINASFYTVYMFSGSLDNVIAAMGDEPFDFIGLPYNDAATLKQMGEEMNDSSGRWSWSRQLYGHVYTAKIGPLTELVAFGEALNDPHLTIAGYEPKTQTAPEELLASRLGRQAVFIRNDPARPTQTGEITGALPAPVGERFSMTERQSLLTHGIASSTVNSGTLLIERDITTYQKNKFGVADNSYLDSETLHTSAYVLRKLKSVITTKYPRHKLANDGTRFGPGQAIVTPSVLRGETCAAYREMELAGIVENFDVFKKYLIVERNADDPNRVDVLFPPDYVNQLRVFALKNQFRLQYSNEEMANG